MFYKSFVVRIGRFLQLPLTRHFKIWFHDLSDLLWSQLGNAQLAYFGRVDPLWVFLAAKKRDFA